MVRAESIEGGRLPRSGRYRGRQLADPSTTNSERCHLGAYRIERCLGRGGMGEVFLAWDERLDRHVAIKRIRTDRQLDARHRARLRHEARAVARLSHPAIVQIYDILELEDGDCIVMEHVEGSSLDQLIARQEMDLRLAVKLAAEIAEGLGEAHIKGFVHRDLKPQNVIVTSAGHAKILDFGLARTLWHDHQGEETTMPNVVPLTAPGELIGTVYAMSPEQANGLEVDHRSDLFALGSLLYEMVTGQAPFRGRNLLETLRRVIGDEPPPIAELAPQIPLELAALIDRLILKDPGARPQNARLVAAALERIAALTTGTIPVTSTGAPAPAASFSQTATDELTHPSGSWPARAVSTPVLRVLVLTDLVESTSLVESLGDSRAVDVLARHDRAARDLLARFGGLEIDKSDGFFLLFERPADAVSYAIAYHQALDRLSQTLGIELAARVGVHLGEVFLRQNAPQDVVRGAKPLEVEGLAKPIAARLMAQAGARQTLLTRAIFDLARRDASEEQLADWDLRWLSHGSYHFHGVAQAVEVFEVGIEGYAPFDPPAQTMRSKTSLWKRTLSAWMGFRPVARPALSRLPVAESLVP